MKFGVCCSPDQSETYAELGFDFVEWSVASNVGMVDEAGFDAIVAHAGGLRIQPEAWNILLPGDIRVTGPQYDPAALRRYLDVALSRVKTLGGAVVVFGSGKSRSISEGFDAPTARQQFVDACATIADAAAANDLVIAFEPLRGAETNLINRIDEGGELVRTVNAPAFRLLADHYHMLENGEDETVVESVSELLVHAHVAAAGSRLAPLESPDVEALGRFLTALKSAGYVGRLSFETRDTEAEVYGRALDVLKNAWAAA